MGKYSSFANDTLCQINRSEFLEHLAEPHAQPAPDQAECWRRDGGPCQAHYGLFISQTISCLCPAQQDHPATSPP